MTIIYFYFGNICVFWVVVVVIIFFHFGQTYSWIACHNVEKHLRWRPHTRLFFVFTEKNISLFGEDNFGFNQPINFKNQNSLDTRSFSAIFHEVPEADNCAHKCAHYAPALLFCGAKMKKENKRKKERVSKKKLLKSYHPGQNVTVLVMFIVLF